MTESAYAAMARDAGLAPVGARPPFWSYMAEAWRRRAFATTLAGYRISASLGANRLGLFWLVLKPTLMAALYGTVFGFILSSDTRPDNFVPFLVTGFYIFEFFATTFSQGARSIIRNQSLVRSLNFPRILLPITVVLQRLFELAAMMGVLVVILFLWREPVTWNWLLLIPILAMMTLFNAGVALIAARLTVHLRDLTEVIPVITRLLFYGSGIFYSLELVLADRPDILRLAQLNPVHDFIALARAALVSGNDFSPNLWIIASAATVLVFTFGLVFFWQAEERYSSV